MLGRPGNTLEVRELSPLPGTSILITSAPRSAISTYGTVPACAVEHATTFTPSSGPRVCAIAIPLLYSTRSAVDGLDQRAQITDRECLIRDFRTGKRRRMIERERSLESD